MLEQNEFTQLAIYLTEYEERFEGLIHSSPVFLNQLAANSFLAGHQTFLNLLKSIT